MMGGMKLSESLRVATMGLHRSAERAGIMRSLLNGELDRRGYCAFLRNLHAIYRCLEEALEHNRTHPHVAPVHFPALYRCAKLAQDLEALHGAHWAQDLRMEPAAARYVSRLIDIADSAPALIVSHAYVRYFGDLNGGQLLSGLVQGAYELADARGTAFYDFEEAGDVDTLKAHYRTALDAITVDAAARDHLVAEAQLAFRLHIQLFEELA